GPRLRRATLRRPAPGRAAHPVPARRDPGDVSPPSRAVGQRPTARRPAARQTVGAPRRLRVAGGPVAALLDVLAGRGPSPRPPERLSFVTAPRPARRDREPPPRARTPAGAGGGLRRAARRGRLASRGRCQDRSCPLAEEAPRPAPPAPRNPPRPAQHPMAA